MISFTIITILLSPYNDNIAFSVITQTNLLHQLVQAREAAKAEQARKLRNEQNKTKKIALINHNVFVKVQNTQLSVLILLPPPPPPPPVGLVGLG